ncbi:uncharacterized protein LAESUDRAFT_689564 [Laetiporus sulphureus 93-53]|uniref:Uncharacterized protein n=1 Tax=Laetiporus sulphureus 93-53 TaxID=1314785 RepID=A0A165I9C1_9APHY|nr:uncharacterized protein LAESUDRAFT_689564 [Laetiporus sulphureus 93-53]KZT12762.1 hypothetical protein LAESUDRAFT_689564 [Laetiporus sulphureus 93-53]
MNYLAQNALPTPPHSPRALEPAHGAVVLLDSLTAFYQQERYWIHHTRAALEVAIAKGSDARTITYAAGSPAESSDGSSVSSSEGPSSPAASTSSVVDDPAPMGAAPVKSESHDVPLAPKSKRSTRWNRRKNMMKLKLEGISPHARRRRPHRASPAEPGARLLEMFSQLVDARMESCQRVSRLVRESHRTPADLCLALL